MHDSEVEAALRLLRQYFEDYPDADPNMPVVELVEDLAMSMDSTTDEVDAIRTFVENLRDEKLPRIVDYAEIFPGGAELWYVRLKSDNGETIMTSEGYNNHAWAKKIAEDFGVNVRQVTE